MLLPTATASPIPRRVDPHLAAEGVHRPVDGADGHGLKPRQAPGVLPHGADAADDVVAEDGLRVSDRGRSGDGALFEIAQVDRNGGRADVDGNAPGGVRRPGSGGRQREQRGQTFLNHLRREPALGGDLDGDRPVNHGAAGQAVPRRHARIPQGICAPTRPARSAPLRQPTPPGPGICRTGPGRRSRSAAAGRPPPWPRAGLRLFRRGWFDRQRGFPACVNPSALSISTCG